MCENIEAVWNMLKIDVCKMKGDIQWFSFGDTHTHRQTDPLNICTSRTAYLQLKKQPPIPIEHVTDTMTIKTAKEL